MKQTLKKTEEKDPENPLNPKHFKRSKLNVFKQKFNYPPTVADKKANNQINKCKKLFKSGMMVPPGHNTVTCDCGNVYCMLVLESNKPVIDHSQPTWDSRDGALAVYMMKTGKCECTVYYSGTEDRLVRYSTAN